MVSGQSLHDAVQALGLTRYSVEEMNDLVPWPPWELAEGPKKREMDMKGDHQMDISHMT